MFTISFFARSWAGKADEFLVQATQAGDSTAFEAIYEKYHKSIYSYVWNLLNYNYDDTVNVTSDVFIKLYEYIKKNSSIQNLKSTIYRIAHNTTIDYLRLHQHDFVRLDPSIDVADVRENIELDREFKEKLLMSLLKNLDVHQREILYLYYQESKTYEEIAEMLDLNKNTVGTILFSAKKRLNDMASHHGIKEGLLL